MKWIFFSWHLSRITAKSAILVSHLLMLLLFSKGNEYLSWNDFRVSCYGRWWLVTLLKSAQLQSKKNVFRQFLHVSAFSDSFGSPESKLTPYNLHLTEPETALGKRLTGFCVIFRNCMNDEKMQKKKLCGKFDESPALETRIATGHYIIHCVDVGSNDQCCPLLSHPSSDLFRGGHATSWLRNVLY